VPEKVTKDIKIVLKSGLPLTALFSKFVRSLSGDKELPDFWKKPAVKIHHAQKSQQILDSVGLGKSCITSRLPVSGVMPAALKRCPRKSSSSTMNSKLRIITMLNNYE
jgi:DNA-directed RNA polymerase subunit N (RpoN/RPB10)